MLGQCIDRSLELYAPLGIAKDGVLPRGKRTIQSMLVSGSDGHRVQINANVDALEAGAALDRAAHQATPASSPRATGTPRNEPYSLHEPS